MLAARLIPMIWLRLVAVVLLGAYMVYTEAWVFVAIAGVLAVISVVQLRSAYRQRDTMLDGRE